MPLIQCLIKRDGPTPMKFGDKVYMFQENENGDSVCNIPNDGHVSQLLNFSWFKIYQGEGGGSIRHTEKRKRYPMKPEAKKQAPRPKNPVKVREPTQGYLEKAKRKKELPKPPEPIFEKPPPIEKPRIEPVKKPEPEPEPEPVKQPEKAADMSTLIPGVIQDADTD